MNKKNFNDISEMQKYIIIQGNNIFFGILIFQVRNIFTDYKILCREGSYYKNKSSYKGT